MRELFEKWDSYSWAGLEYGWLLWLIVLAAAWGFVKWLLGKRWRLPLAPGMGRPGRFASLPALLPRLLRLAGLAFLLIALLRPQTILNNSESSVQAIDIFLVIDVSGSMEAMDLRPNRLAAAKATLIKFVDGLSGDRVGLVVFAGKAFTQCPLSVDHEVVKHFIGQVEIGSTVKVGGTAVGDGLLLAVQRLVQDPKRDQVIILATDGRSNRGQQPLLGAKVAAQAGIKVYTIGIGQKGGAPRMAKDFYGRTVQNGRWEEPDEKTLRGIAAATGGRYFRAIDERSLDSIYAQIANLERREVKVRNFSEAEEHFWEFLFIGFLLLGLEALLRIRYRLVY